MKLKEVCEKTGLTKKTIRFYEEKQLIFPEVRCQNGRNYREYTQKNVEDLLEIATLRKALFSLEEIYTMQQDPEEIVTIVSDYAERIKSFSQTLQVLSSTVDQLNVSAIKSVSELADAIGAVSNDMPLPSYDVKPNFRHIDELEIEELEIINRSRQNARGEATYFLEHQQFTVRKGLFQENFPYNHLLNGGSSNFPRPQEPKALSVVNIIVSAVILICALITFFYVQQRKISMVNTWNQIKGWVISIGLLAVAVRLLTAKTYQAVIDRNWRKICKSFGIVAITVIFIVCGMLTRMRFNESRSYPDIMVVVACETPIDDQNREMMEAKIEEIISDANEDEKNVATIMTLQMTNENDRNVLKEYIASGECALFFMDKSSYDIFISTLAQFSDLEFMELTTEIQTPETPYLCDISDTPFLSEAGLGREMYGFVLKVNNSALERDAVEVLEKLINS